jgi:hypothetical protein
MAQRRRKSKSTGLYFRWKLQKFLISGPLRTPDFDLNGLFSELSREQLRLFHDFLHMLPIFLPKFRSFTGFRVLWIWHKVLNKRFREPVRFPPLQKILVNRKLKKLSWRGLEELSHKNYKVDQKNSYLNFSAFELDLGSFIFLVALSMLLDCESQGAWKKARLKLLQEFLRLKEFEENNAKLTSRGS